MSDLVAQVDIESEMRRLSGLLDQATRKILHRAMRAAHAEVDYKVAFAKRMLQVEAKTVGEREAIATVDTADEYLDRKIADARLTSAQEAARNLRAQLSALQTYSANQRYLIDRGASGYGG